MLGTCLEPKTVFNVIRKRKRASRHSRGRGINVLNAVVVDVVVHLVERPDHGDGELG